jgi:hypothetical protein
LAALPAAAPAAPALPRPQLTSPPCRPRAQLRSLSEKMRELQSSHDAQVRHVLDKYASLRKAVGEYNGSLVQALGSSRQQGLALEAVDLNSMVID